MLPNVVPMIVVYFDKRLGAVHSKHWSENAFSIHFLQKSLHLIFGRKTLKTSKINKKIETAKKNILAVPQSWLKYTTHAIKVGYFSGT